MHVGSETATRTPLILLLSWTSISLAEISTIESRSNSLGIDWDPAPSPEDGPPLSAGASRDKSLLPAQIGGIVGAYLFSVCVVGIALIVIGRRLRRQIQRSCKALDIEMVHPTGASLYPSPISPISAQAGSRNFSWPSPEKADRNPYVFPPSIKSLKDQHVDDRVVQADRELLDRGLEDIYAHVMEQEDAKVAGIVLKDAPLPAGLNSPGPVPATAPQRQDTPTKKPEKSKPATLDINVEGNRSPKTHSRSSSIISSLKSPKRKGIRGMRISSPIPTPLSATFPGGNASDEEPLTPRYYAPPPPPPVPTDQVPHTHSRNTSTGYSPVSPTRSIAEQLSPHAVPQQFQHRPNASQTSVNSARDPISATSANSSTPLYSPSHPPNNSVGRGLPLRQFEPSITSTSFSQTTKTTVLERTSPLSPSGLKTPWSAGAVPYSPYQPFTPIMPITPKLVTKEERKRKKKEEGRAPVLEMIKSDDELWDSSY